VLRDDGLECAQRVDVRRVQRQRDFLVCLPVLYVTRVCVSEVRSEEKRETRRLGPEGGTGLPPLPQLQHHPRPFSRPAEPSVPDAIEAPSSASSEARVARRLRAHTAEPRPPRAWKQIGGDDVHAWKQARNRHQDWVSGMSRTVKDWMEINDCGHGVGHLGPKSNGFNVPVRGIVVAQSLYTRT
jgi:hypothetical protein